MLRWWKSFSLWLYLLCAQIPCTNQLLLWKRPALQCKHAPQACRHPWQPLFGPARFCQCWRQAPLQWSSQVRMWSFSFPWRFTLSEWSISNFPCSLTTNITSHSMKDLAFHSLLRWKMITTTNSHYLTYTFLLKWLGECTFWAWEWKA